MSSLNISWKEKRQIRVAEVIENGFMKKKKSYEKNKISRSRKEVLVKKVPNTQKNQIEHDTTEKSEFLYLSLNLCPCLQNVHEKQILVLVWYLVFGFCVLHDILCLFCLFVPLNANLQKVKQK